MVEAATRLLAGHLEASHCRYAEIGVDMEGFTTRGCWFATGIDSVPRSGRIADFSPELITTSSAVLARIRKPLLSRRAVLSVRRLAGPDPHVIYCDIQSEPMPA